MNIDQLRAFITVIQYGGFHAASEVLHRTQPTISTAIKNLEQLIGFELIDRDTTPVTLTPKGKAFHEKAQVLLKQFEALKQYGNHLQTGIESEIGIAIDELLPLSKVLPTLKQLINIFPNTHFCLYTEALGGPTERLLDGTANIVISEQFASLDIIESIPFYQQEMVPVATPEYLAINQERLACEASIDECTQIIMRDSSLRMPKYSFGLIENARYWMVSGIEEKKELILAQIGWGRLPLTIIEEELSCKKLIELNYAHIGRREVPLSCMRHRLTEHGPVTEAVWQALTDS